MQCVEFTTFDLTLEHWNITRMYEPEVTLDRVAALQPKCQLFTSDIDNELPPNGSM